MTDDPTPVTEDEAEAPAAASSGRAPLVLAVTLAVLFAVIALGLGLVLAARGDDDGGTADVRAAAGAFGEALVTYDHQDPDAHRDAVLARATGSFRDEYEDAFEQGLRELITEAEATSVGTVKDVYVSEVDDDQAQAIVVADVEHDGTGGPSTLYDVYFRLTFVKVDGEWMVDDVTDLNFDPAATSPTSPTSGAPESTTTSLP